MTLLNEKKLCTTELVFQCAFSKESETAKNLSKNNISYIFMYAKS